MVSVTIHHQCEHAEADHRENERKNPGHFMPIP